MPRYRPTGYKNDSGLLLDQVEGFVSPMEVEEVYGTNLGNFQYKGTQVF